MARHGESAFTSLDPWRPWHKVTAPSYVGSALAARQRPAAGVYLADKGFNGFSWHQWCCPAVSG